MGLEDFIFSHPAQISLLGIQFQWTADTQVRAPAAFAARKPAACCSRRRGRRQLGCARACQQTEAAAPG
jgi:dynein heavy chain